MNTDIAMPVFHPNDVYFFKEINRPYTISVDSLVLLIKTRMTQSERNLINRIFK